MADVEINRLQQNARAILVEYRAEAFDNVNVDGLLSRRSLDLANIKWIAEHLARNARSSSGFEAGRKLLAEIRQSERS
jgi:hypothetical protein